MSSGFVSENELESKRKARQEEWEKVRQPGQPLEMPEEPYDHRSLFERLEEQKQKKQLEYEEAHKLKNMIKGLDDDEVEFLDLIDKKKLEAEQLKEIEEKKELFDFRVKVEKLKEINLDKKIQSEIQFCKSKSSTSTGNKLKGRLAGIIKKRKISNDEAILNNDDGFKNEENFKSEIISKKKKVEENINEMKEKVQLKNNKSFLPGLVSYVETSDDDSDATSDCG